ncbi:MAG: citramalate synthase [Candidatus Methanomethylophilaceae archaeon]|jgi:2-isopropylmalate synthase
MNLKVVLYDTTLRDGAQSEGISFSVQDKLDILTELDRFGMDFVEGGWPGSNPVDTEFFSKAKDLNLSHAKLCAFGSTRRRGMKAEEDTNLRNIAGSGAEWACIFGKTWDFHVEKALNISKEENLAIIKESIEFLVESGMKVMFDAEHFFDGFYSDGEYAMKAVSAAAEAGAEWIVLCDTNGGTLPDRIADAVSAVKKNIDAKIGIHCHNDSELAVACSLAAVKAGAEMVQGCVNGIGERTGNANMCSIIPNLMLKMGRNTNVKDLSKLTELSKYVGEVSNTVPPSSMPYVGEKAFAHKGGMHVSALAKDSRTYEHINPETVGNRRRVLVSDMSGRASISEKLKELGITEEGCDSELITATVKELESKGYQFEGADASFELLVKRLRKEAEPHFTIAGFRLFIDETENGKLISEASIKVKDREGNIEHTASDGDGPVNAMDNALRKALSKFYPVLNSIRLSDYKVRVLDEKAATAAPVRVLIRSTDGNESWTTVGVSENVIEASLIALVDSLEYAIALSERKG